MPISMDESSMSHKITVARKPTKSSPVSRRTTEQGRSTSSSDWTDDDESPPQARRSRKHSSRRYREITVSSSNTSLSQHNLERDASHFLPSLSGTTEVNESGSRLSTRTSRQRNINDKVWIRRRQKTEESTSTSRRPSKPQIGDAQIYSWTLPKSSCVTSVLSVVPETSDRSSESSDTITQQSYNRNAEHVTRVMEGEAGYPERNDGAVGEPLRSQRKSINVFDYMQPTVEDDNDAGSVLSSSQPSTYQASDAGSSEVPGSPSSRSTFPSPIVTRSELTSDLQLQDSQRSSSRQGSHKGSCSSETSHRFATKKRLVRDVSADDEEVVTPHVPHPEASEPLDSPRVPTSPHHWMQSSAQQSEGSVRQHSRSPLPVQVVDPVYAQPQSFPNSSIYTDPPPPPLHIAWQPYQWPASSPPVPYPFPPQPMNGHLTRREYRTNPNPPTLNQNTLAGYEKLARELSNPTSSISPLYRKFSHLNHRVLLHLQDELSEVEEELRILDEIIAQTSPVSKEGRVASASRRQDAMYGDEIALRRTNLLGRIFFKTEQYNRSLAAYADVSKNFPLPEEGQVEMFSRWLEVHAPVDEAESRFLNCPEDLVMLSEAAHAKARVEREPSAYAFVVLILPAVMCAFIPSLTGKVVVTAFISLVLLGFRHRVG